MLHQAAAIRQLFLAYFGKHHHTQVPSSPLSLHDDPSLLFTNAGMVQFKDVFLGVNTRSYSRAVSCQKCLRVSGKHNDLEEVGRTARHHTFFEMLGNFSFGDYFKEEAIVLAWQFIRQELQLPTARLWVTTFAGDQQIPADQETMQLWRKISGLPAERCLAKGAADNFWMMGEQGPCGPCTEIHVDLGTGPVVEADFTNGRLVEIWNNVFMQYNRSAEGVLTLLPAPCVDTGMGLERVAALVAGETSNYHTDLFLPIIETVAAAGHLTYQRGDHASDIALRVIADHARAAAFLIAEGQLPSNENRGYVLRRIMRRAIRHGSQQGLHQPFLHLACDAVVNNLQAFYPELRQMRDHIETVVLGEEESFRRTLNVGTQLLQQVIGSLPQTGAVAQLPGEVIFKLYDTYGFPKDLTQVMAAEHQVALDEVGFSALMQEQQDRSRSDVGKGNAQLTLWSQIGHRIGEQLFIGDSNSFLTTQPPGYEDTILYPAQVVACVVDGCEVNTVAAGQSAQIVLQPNPFYGESGGQIGDRGVLLSEQGQLLAVVSDAQRANAKLTWLHVQPQQLLTCNMKIIAGYPNKIRAATCVHHSATHLLHYGLRAHLGQHVTQAGSLVTDEGLRFDFTHPRLLSPQQLQIVEDEVATLIKAQAPVVIETMLQAIAKKQGAMALFGEKYGELVRMVKMGPSLELCGGTHVRHTGEMDPFLIVREEAVQSGVRRIHAKAGAAAQAFLQLKHAELQATAALLNQATVADFANENQIMPILTNCRRLLARSAAPAALPTVHLPQQLAATVLRRLYQAAQQLSSCKPNEGAALAMKLAAVDVGGLLAVIGQLHATIVVQEQDQQRSYQQQLQQLTKTLLQQCQSVGAMQVITAQCNDLGQEGLKTLADNLRQKVDNLVLLLVSDDAKNGKRSLVIALAPAVPATLHAGHLAKALTGRGGGRRDFAQAGAEQTLAIDVIFDQFIALLPPS